MIGGLGYDSGRPSNKLSVPSSLGNEWASAIHFGWTAVGWGRAGPGTVASEKFLYTDNVDLVFAFWGLVTALAATLRLMLVEG